MSTRMNRQLDVLQGIAQFSAGLRGHELKNWETGEAFAAAECAHCGAHLRVYFPALYPDMDGSALEYTCAAEVTGARAA